MVKKRTLRRSPAQPTPRQVLAPTTKQIRNTLKALKGVSKSLSKKAQALAEEVELQRIETLLGEDFDSLAQAKRALAKETKKLTKRVVKENQEFIRTLRRGKSRPAQLVENKIVPQAPVKSPRKPFTFTPFKPPAPPPIKPATDILTIPRDKKYLYAQKIGKERYLKLLREWWEEFPDEDPNDNPYCYHGKD